MKYSLFLVLALIEGSVCASSTLCLGTRIALSRADFGDYEKGRELFADSAKSVKETIGLSNDARVFFLGEGDSARTYRVLERSGASVIFRVYENTDEDLRDLDSIMLKTQHEYARDKKYFDLYQLASMARRPDETLLVSKIIGFDDDRKILKMEDARGYQVDSIFRKLKGTPLYVEFVAEYNSRLRAFIGAIASHVAEIQSGPRDTMFPEAEAFIVRLPNEAHVLGVASPYNTVYNLQTGQFRIFDPL